LQQSQNWGHARHLMSLAMAFREEIAAARLALFVGTRGLVVKAGPHTAFKPDVVVFAGPIDDHDIIVPRPLIVVEVLSESTARRDRTVKLDGYFAVPTIEHYLLVDWEERAVTHYRREGGELTKPVIVRDCSLTLDPPGLTVDISRMFQDS
jgi:Uma2 family endonuclease